MPESIPELEALLQKDRQLNAIRDPLTCLPLEISSEIFFQCLPPGPLHPRPGARTPPLLLLNICNSWTDIALYTPALWSSIYLDFPGVQVLQSWLERARNHALTISLTRSLNRNIGAILKHLEIYDDDLKLGSLMQSGHSPALETLTIGCLELYTNRITVVHDLLAALANSPTNLLPNIRCLKYSSFLPLDVPSYPIILRLLTLRRTQIVVFTLRGSSRKFGKLSQSENGLRQLAAGGMEIYIGSEGQNLMSFD
ncbi:hypothetical protein C8F04DRAFT_1131315, partial [Mycena alexandri]